MTINLYHPAPLGLIRSEIAERVESLPIRSQDDFAWARFALTQIARGQFYNPESAKNPVLRDKVLEIKSVIANLDIGIEKDLLSQDMKNRLQKALAFQLDLSVSEMVDDKEGEDSSRDITKWVCDTEVARKLPIWLVDGATKQELHILRRHTIKIQRLAGNESASVRILFLNFHKFLLLEKATRMTIDQALQLSPERLESYLLFSANNQSMRGVINLLLVDENLKFSLDEINQMPIEILKQLCCMKKLLAFSNMIQKGLLLSDIIKMDSQSL